VYVTAENPSYQSKAGVLDRNARRIPGAGTTVTKTEFTCVAYVAQAFRPARAPKSRPKGLRYERRACGVNTSELRFRISWRAWRLRAP